jgi:hypothetical protein
MVQGAGLFVVVERAISLNRPLRTRTVGGVGAGGEKPLATRLDEAATRRSLLRRSGFTITPPPSKEGFSVTSQEGIVR